MSQELTELAGSVSDSAAPAPDDEGFAGGGGGGDALANRWAPDRRGGQ